MLGYYNSSDPWVIARHIEMLTLADVDFIFFDATNYYTYAVNHSQQPEGGKIKGAGMAVLDTLLEYYDQGWDVPKVAFTPTPARATACRRSSTPITAAESMRISGSSRRESH